MLIFTSVTTEITQEGPKHMLVFASPRCPGSHDKVEADEGTAARMRALIPTEIRAATMAGHVFGPDEDDSPHEFPFDR